MSTAPARPGESKGTPARQQTHRRDQGAVGGAGPAEAAWRGRASREALGARLDVEVRDMQRMQERYGRMDLKYDDIFEHHVERLTHLEKSVTNYGKTGTNLRKWHSEFKEGMTDEINKKLEELLVAKEVKPGVWKRVANVLNRQNNHKNLENMQKSVDKIHEEVDDLKQAKVTHQDYGKRA